MEKTYLFRIYPNKGQRAQIEKTFGCVRFVYNYYLERRIKSYRENNAPMYLYDCLKDLTKIKQLYPWLYDVDNSALQNSIKNLDRAYRRFFNHTSKFPKFKRKKDTVKSYRTSFTNNNIQFDGKRLRIPKLGWVKARGYKSIAGRILNITVKKMSDGKYYGHLCCADIPNEILPQSGAVVGVDLGIKGLLTTSDGITFVNNRYYQSVSKKLVRLQKSITRKTSGSANRNKARIQYAKECAKVRHARANTLHEISTYLIREYDIICIEDLPIENLVHNHNLAEKIEDAAWGELKRQLSYKADWYGRKIVTVDRFFPSSQLCSCCGAKNPSAKNLSVRRWTCPSCHAKLDRDRNAAINILHEGLRLLK